MKKIHTGHPLTTLILLFFLCSMLSCKKDKTKGQETKPFSKQVSITYLKDLITEQPVKIKDYSVIRGVVISDASSKNVENNKTLFLQEGTNQKGIKVQLQKDHNFALNDSLEIEIFDQTLTRLNGAVVLQDVPNNLVKNLGVGKILPRETSVRELEANKKDWEGSLIRIGICELISDNGKYSENMKIKDGKAILNSRIMKDASFIGQELPKDVSSIVGIVHFDGNEVQLIPRNTLEVRPLKYVIDDFTKWTRTTWNMSSIIPRFTLQTEYADWNGDIYEGPVKQLATAADGSFTKPGKIYPYLPKDSTRGPMQLFPSEKLNLKGLKFLNITFAGSKSVGYTLFSEIITRNEYIRVELLPFNTGVDEVSIGIRIPIESTGEAIPGKVVKPKGAVDFYKIVSMTAPVGEVGKFNAVKFIIPSTLEDLIAMGITSGDREKWLNNPQLEIINLSSRKTSGITDYRQDRYVPILLDQVQMGF